MQKTLPVANCTIHVIKDRGLQPKSCVLQNLSASYSLLYVFLYVCKQKSFTKCLIIFCDLINLSQLNPAKYFYITPICACPFDSMIGFYMA